MHCINYLTKFHIQIEVSATQDYPKRFIITLWTEKVKTSLLHNLIDKTIHILPPEVPPNSIRTLFTQTSCSEATNKGG